MTKIPKILIIEDDVAIREIEKDYLEIADFEVDLAEDGEIGLRKALHEKYDLIILDRMLPKLDGIEVCEKIRDKLDTPIIMVTAKVEEIDILQGLKIGADDYIAKPFKPRELIARVKSHIARYNRIKTNNHLPSKKEYSFADLLIIPEEFFVSVNDEEIKLKKREYELLVYLVENENRVFSKEQLFDCLWGFDAYGDLKTVAVHINRIREKIEKDPSNPQYIHTIWGAGYKFQYKKYSRIVYI